MKNKFMWVFSSSFTPWKLSDYHELIVSDSFNTLLVNSFQSDFCT